MVEPGEGWGAHTPDFGRSINSISTSGGRLCPPHYYSPLPFLDIQTFHHPVPAYYRAGKTRVGKEGNSPAYHILAEMEQNLRTYAAYEIESLVFFLDL